MEIYPPSGGVRDTLGTTLSQSVMTRSFRGGTFCALMVFFWGKILTLVANHKHCVGLVCTCNTLSLRIQTGQALDLFGCSLKEVSSSTLGETFGVFLSMIAGASR